MVGRLGAVPAHPETTPELAVGLRRTGARVGDVTRATLAALDADVGGVLNIGTGIATSVLDLYDVCRWVAGSDAEPIHEAERPGELGRSVLDGELAAAAIGFRAGTSLAAGVAATWQSLQPG